MYKLAEQYYKEKGNLLIPFRYTTIDKIQLGRWIGTQRGTYKKNKLSKEKIELLENIGMDWNPRGIK
ncbi:MAG: helicase associated domain-containing protein [Bacilli bacterium]|nr:helicase associated domain-containing protein [Bacilli bacterium]